MNIELRIKAKNHFEKDFFKQMNNTLSVWKMSKDIEILSLLQETEEGTI